MLFRSADVAALSPGDVSGVIDAHDAYYILLLRDKQAGGEMPVEEVAPFIVMEISSAKDTLALRKVLIEALSSTTISFSPFLRQEAPPVPPGGAPDGPARR